ncbi:MAG: hypothetical protein IPF52_04790 [Saprospiraceae bacterium]|nr:hypothetical protein [Saprospiraceae bacterium]
MCRILQCIGMAAKRFYLPEAKPLQQVERHNETWSRDFMVRTQRWPDIQNTSTDG